MIHNVSQSEFIISDVDAVTLSPCDCQVPRGNYTRRIKLSGVWGIREDHALSSHVSPQIESHHEASSHAKGNEQSAVSRIPSDVKEVFGHDLVVVFLRRCSRLFTRF